MKTYIDILRKFDQNRTASLDSEKDWNEETVAKCFFPCAEDFLCKGYFLLNDEYILDLGSVELYYQEETDGGLKDHAMYHTN